MESTSVSLSYEDYTVGWICAIEPELIAAQAILDDIHPGILFRKPGDSNDYLLGRIGAHNVVIASLPMGTYSTHAAAAVATHMRRSFPKLKYRLLVGVGGGVPKYDSEVPIDIRLGDVVVSNPSQSSGVVQYDIGKIKEAERWPERKGTLDRPPEEIWTAVTRLQAKHQLQAEPLKEILTQAISRYPTLVPKHEYQGVANDVLFEAGYKHVGLTCHDCNPSKAVDRPARPTTSPYIHYGTIGSGTQVIMDSVTRDFWQKEEQIMCVEMEAAGLMDHFRCLVIRGICDYADSHKDKRWQPYAAMTAVAYAKDLILGLSPDAPQGPTKAIGTTVSCSVLAYL